MSNVHVIILKPNEELNEELSVANKLIDDLHWFASDIFMDIRGLTRPVISKLVYSKKVKTIPELYSIKKEDLCELDIPKKRASMIARSIENNKCRPLYKFLFALGIPYVSEDIAKRLAQKYGSLEKVQNATHEELFDTLNAALEECPQLDNSEFNKEINKKIALEIQNYFNNNHELIEEFITAGVKLNSENC
ncbi:MAG: hypothetical protein K6T65_06940 [Peptococcaceae bacterium]|nr:hypothetical protein [Peptococcaceae bacterium]